MEAMLEKVDYIRESRKRESQIKSEASKEATSIKKVEMNLKRTESIDEQVETKKM